MSSRRIIVASGEFLPLLTESLLGVLLDAANALQRCGLNAERYPEPLERFDTIRATLDAIGWGATGDIDLDIHRDALQAALADRLATERHLQESAEEMTSESAEEQRQRAYGCRVQIEAFLHENGLSIPRAGGQDG
jgi:hypothetical protein